MYGNLEGNPIFYVTLIIVIPITTSFVTVDLLKASMEIISAPPVKKWIAEYKKLSRIIITDWNIMI